MMRSHYLKPGEIVLTARPGTITTVLGSCVSVTLRDPASGLSGICHAMLPDSTAWPISKRYPDNYYVDAAIKRMLAEFRTRGSVSARLEVGVMGGAASTDGQFAVGRDNIASALKILAEHSLRPATLDVGGRQGRRVCFDTATGQVESLRISSPLRRKTCSRS